MQRMMTALVSWFMVVSASVAQTASAPAQAAASVVDPEAAKIVKRFSDSIRAAKTIKFELVSTIRSENEGMRQEFFTRSTFAIERPNKVAYVLRKGFMGGTMVCDGADLTLYVPMMNQYEIQKGPARLDSDVMLQAAMMLSGGGLPVIRTFLIADPGEDMLDGVSKATVAGVEKIGGVACRRVRFEQDEFDWEAWFEQKQPGLVRKIAVDTAKAMQQMLDQQEGAVLPPMMRGTRNEAVFEFKGWALDGKLPPDTFVFTPPASATKVDSLFALEDEDAPGKTLVGKAAPAFKLPLLDGGEFDLAAHAGRNVVVLDFWATWCVPCRKAMPIIAEVTTQFKDRGVLFFAVNQGEDKETIATFIKGQKIQCPVVLDAETVTAGLYNISSIPHCVIVDRAGIVRNVHIGVTPNYRSVLTEEIEALLATPAANPTPAGKP